LTSTYTRLDLARPIDLEKAPVVGPSAAFVLHGKIKETIYNRIQDHALGSEPRSARAVRVDPNVEHVFG
jgi:hypothetical protein